MALSMVSIRNAAQAAMRFARSPMGRLVRIEVLVICCSVILSVLVVLGSNRRRIRSAVLRFLVWGAFLVSYPAVSYTVGLMQSAQFRNELCIIWGCFLLLLLGCADSVAAYNLDVDEQQARTMWNQGLQSIYVLLLLLNNVDVLQVKFKVILLLLWVLSVGKLARRIKTNMSAASRSHELVVDNRAISEYMGYEHQLSNGQYYVFTMRGYKYIITGEVEASRSPTDDASVVTVEKVWLCEGRLLGPWWGDGDLRMRDVSLSFALFKLLRRRLGGCPLHETDLPKTRELVVDGLLAHNDIKRGFRIVEVELGFLFDFFYGRYPSPKESLLSDTLLFLATVATSLYALGSLLPVGYQKAPGQKHVYLHGFNMDLLLTQLVVLLLILLESFQFISLVFSDWNKVKMISWYVRNRWLREHWLVLTWLEFVCRCSSTRVYWRNAVDQYTLLVAACVQSKTPYHRASWCADLKLLAAGRSVPLTESVRDALLEALKRNRGELSDGWSSLLDHSLLQQLGWACSAGQSVAHKVLVWHIATTLCEFSPGCTSSDSEVLEDRHVATTLSRYCAYLVSSAPELLSGRTYDARLLFDSIQLRAQGYLTGCNSKADIYREMFKYSADEEMMDESDAVLAAGAHLCARLIETTNTDKLWKVLADVSVNLMLYISPADNATAHVQRLATGGELITHLWALLTHAGILDSPPDLNEQWPMRDGEQNGIHFPKAAMGSGNHDNQWKPCLPGSNLEM